MCGIIGWLSTKTPVMRARFEAMTDRLSHRGPDGRGTAYFRDDRIALGHRRLAIQDLSSAGAQPMQWRSSQYEPGLAVTFNGEIYNHPELRRDLESHGAVYTPGGDTETLLHAYLRWGPAMVERLRGIFAFAIWDERSGELFAARDHFGVKPFYIAECPDGMAFASQVSAFFELEGFHKSIRAQGFVDALRHGVSTGEETIFDNVIGLGPGHCLVWHEGRRSTQRFWSLPEQTDIGCARRAREELSSLIAESIGAQMLGDVPVHSLLSGGVDSSLVTALAARQPGRFGQAFTLGFDDPKFDESSYAIEAAETIGCPHSTHVFPAQEAETLLDTAIDVFDEPYGIDSALPMVAIAQILAQSGVKVVLSGDGGDELFGGYRHYDDLAAHYARRGRICAESNPATVTGQILDWLAGGFSPFPTYTCHNGWFGEKALNALAGPRLANCLGDPFRRERAVFPQDRPPVEAARRADIASYLPDEILVKIDRATMAFGIEARVPLLDHRLVELAFRIEPALHYCKGERKALLKAVAADFLPESLLGSRKKGFSAPLHSLFFARPRDRKRVVKNLERGPLVEDGWLARPGIDRAVKQSEYPDGALFQLLMIDRWYRHWMSVDKLT